MRMFPWLPAEPRNLRITCGDGDVADADSGCHSSMHHGDCSQVRDVHAHAHAHAYILAEHADVLEEAADSGDCVSMLPVDT